MHLLIFCLPFFWIQQTDAPGTNNTIDNDHTTNPPETNYTLEDEHTTAPKTNHAIENEQTIAAQTNNTTSDEAGSNEEVLHVTPVQKSVETPNQEPEVKKLHNHSNHDGFFN